MADSKEVILPPHESPGFRHRTELNRTIFMKYKMKPLIAFFTLLVPSLLVFAETKKPAQPNLIFILADDLGWKDVGFMGCEFFETPNIDRLAKEGMTFTAAYSGGPNCAPTRACLMSGTYTPPTKSILPVEDQKEIQSTCACWCRLVSARTRP